MTDEKTMHLTDSFSTKFQYVSVRTEREHFIFQDFAIILTFLFVILQVKVMINEQIVVLIILTSRDRLLLFFQFQFIILKQMIRS
jgi:hypothetical protein